MKALSSPPKVVLVTGHYWYSKRRAGFHWLADAFHGLGWEVVFLTTTISWLSYLRGDHRTKYPDVWNQRNRLIRVEPNLYSFVWLTPFHPAHLRSSVLNQLSRPIFRLYGALPLGEVEGHVRTADWFVFESTPGLLLFERFKQINPKAKFVYRVSDDLRLLKNSPLVLEAEEKALPFFDLVSVPSKYLWDKFNGKARNLRLHFHAIRKELFDQPCTNPYADLPGPHCVFVGVSHFDHDFLERASRLFPDWQFHIVGPIQQSVRRSNVHYYGEKPFLQTIPYIKWADIGLANRSYSPGAESLSDSLKIVQYTYARLPIVAPAFLDSKRSNLYTYQPGDDESIKRALLLAREHDRNSIPINDIYSWKEFVEKLIRDLEGD